MSYQKNILRVAALVFIVACFGMLGLTTHAEDDIQPQMDGLGDYGSAYDQADPVTPGHPTRNSVVEPVPNMQLSEPDLDPVPLTGNAPPSGDAPSDSAYRSGLVPCSGPDCTIEDLLVLGANIFTFLISLVGILAIGALVFAGFLYMTAAGNESQIAKSKQVATWAIIGLVLALFSVVLIQFILEALEATDIDVINE